MKKATAFRTKHNFIDNLFRREIKYARLWWFIIFRNFLSVITGVNEEIISWGGWLTSLTKWQISNIEIFCHVRERNNKNNKTETKTTTTQKTREPPQKFTNKLILSRVRPMITKISAWKGRSISWENWPVQSSFFTDQWMALTKRG